MASLCGDLPYGKPESDDAARAHAKADAHAKASSAISRTERRLAELLLAAVDGDSHAYHVFLSELAQHLRLRLRRQLVGQGADLEDVVQEVLIAVHRSLDTFRPDVPVTAWVSAIARYKLADHFRAHARRIDMFAPLDDEVSETKAAPSTLDAFEADRDLTRLLSTLPAQQREVIVETKLTGCSVSETAARTGLSESAVKVNVHRGLKALAAKIRKRSNGN
jgi:RNA polymerase sigma-70 factor, ECF subfamily